MKTATTTTEAIEKWVEQEVDNSWALTPDERRCIEEGLNRGLEIAKEFAEWKDDNYIKVLGGYIHRMGNIANSHRYTTEELLSEYIKSLNK